MTQISVIIVNYNVRYFLEQSLHSVYRALADINGEVIVVDNASKDDSVEMVEKKFPSAKLIRNEENAGFSAANNQGIQIARGQYVLLLNPDTVVEEDTFRKTLSFMDNHPDAGGLGVKMVDGKGNFLPESKRSLPTPSVAFYKIFGLSSLFPRSRIFGKYHLGYLDNDDVHSVEVLSGAFMLMRKEALDKAGLLDENFFMYGEDIDLSYRILKAGYKNYYYPHTRIIHYKGESTKKGSLNYVRLFYKAMIIFARKHFSQQKAAVISFFIYIGIVIKAMLSIFQRVFNSIYFPLLDAGLIFLGMYLIKDFWEKNIKEELIYPLEYLYINIPLYIFVWLITVFFSGGYDKPFRLGKMVRGLMLGTVFIAAIYGFLPEDLRFSRAMILLGTAWAGFIMIILRLMINLLRFKQLQLEERNEKRIIIAGSYEEGKRVLSLLNQSGIHFNFMGFITPDDPADKEEEHLGTLDQLAEITEIYKADEVIFCAKDLSSAAIIREMTRIGKNLEYKIVPKDSLSIIGSSSKNKAGDLYALDINLNIILPEYKRNKQLLDIIISLFLLGSLAIHVFLVKNPGGLIGNIFAVLSGKKSWVGYKDVEQPKNQQFRLPAIKEGVLSPVDGLKNTPPDEQVISRLNLFYAKDYSTRDDLQIIVKGYRELGRREE